MIVTASAAEHGQSEETRLDTKYVIEYDILRVILTILVVVGHAAYISHVTAYGGCDYSVFIPSNEKSLFLQTASRISMLIYLFHMPLFMSLSGALFYHSFENRKYCYLKTLLIEKGKKLLIPFFVVGVLYSFPIKLLVGESKNTRNM